MEPWQMIMLGLIVGACGAAVKAVLMQCFFLKGKKSLSILAFSARLVIDVGVLFALHHMTAALIAAAIGLCLDQIYFVASAQRQKGG